MTVTGLCRGGMFPAADDAGRRAALDDNRRAVDEAAAIGAQCLILVAGGLPKGSTRHRRRAHGRCATGWPRCCPMRGKRGVPLAIEPLHPMFAADRACVNTLAHANDLCDELGEGVGVAIDTYHVWWDPDLAAPDRARGRATSWPTTSTTGWCRPRISCSTAA